MQGVFAAPSFFCKIILKAVVPAPCFSGKVTGWAFEYKTILSLVSVHSQTKTFN